MFNLVLKASDVVIGFKCSNDNPFNILGYEVAYGKIQIPRKRLEHYASCQMPKTKKALEKLIGQVGFFGNFSTAFSEALTALRRELHNQKSKKFVFTPMMQKIVDITLELLITTPGLHLLTKSEWENSPFIVMVDASHKSYGAALLCLTDENTLKPVAVSAFFSRTTAATEKSS